MIELIPEKVDFIISTTDVDVNYNEHNGVRILVDCQNIEQYQQNVYTNLLIEFKTVAEIKCTTLNFFELNFNNFSIQQLEYLPSLEYWMKYNLIIKMDFILFLIQLN